ncbi:MAG: 50S ribosomal protein L10, partial [Thaumarchaeota archaeon]|nr:50S ribosomal protein L10 [Nitrososphaerota archaeon]
MYENRQKWPPKKEKMYAQLQELPSKHGVMAIVRMEKVRASQILSLRKRLRGEVEFVNVKGKVTKKALAGLGVPGIAEIVAQVKGQCMFIFTDMSPFKLNVLLARNKVMLAARGGDTASVDVTIPAKNTGIAPGPMLTEFKEANVPTKIDQGTIWITKDTLAARRGETISPKLAALLGKLDIKAVEAGVELAGALEAGLFYTREDLIVDVGAV